MVSKSVKEHREHTFFSDFQLVTRRLLTDCPDRYPHLQIQVSPDSDLPDVVNVTVTVSGVLVPEETDWVAKISPVRSDVSKCPLDEVMCLETGNLSKLPLQCHYPVKVTSKTKFRD